MKSRFPSLAVLVALFALTASAAWAGNAKVQVCHIPPGNPGNFHTITISENALQAHLGHGDIAGTCFAHCDKLCDDGNPCTIDACDANEQCLTTHPPVNCDDGNRCTIDSCNPASGCVNVPKTCADGNNCTVDACDPLTGSCVAPPVVCPAGQACNPANGQCASTAECPCTSLPPWNAILAGANSCRETSLGVFVSTLPVFDFTEYAESDKPQVSGSFSCEYSAAGTSDHRNLTSAEESLACVQLIRNAIASRGLTCQ